jgi:hypothetical protein
VLPALLAERDLDALTVVFHSASVYLSEEDRASVRKTLEEDGRRGSLAWVSYEYAEAGSLGFALDARSWPGESQRLARLDGHGNELEWIA